MTATITHVIDSAEHVWHEYSDEIIHIEDTEFLITASVNIADTAIAMIKINLMIAWADENRAMDDVDAETYNALADVEHMPATVIPDIDLCESVWRKAVDALDFDDIVRSAGLAAEYATFVRAQPDYSY